MEEREYIDGSYRVKFMTEVEAGTYIINFLLNGWIAFHRDCKSNMIVLAKGMTQEYIVIEEDKEEYCNDIR